MTEVAQARFPWRAVALCTVAWLIPGGGHLLLGKRARSAGFLLVIASAFLLGMQLQGNLYTIVPGQPLSFLGTLGAMGVGLPYFVARLVVGFAGDPAAAMYEYGSIFLLSAGLMNLLLVLDVWDHALGRKVDE